MLKTNRITLCALFKFSRYENVISVNILEIRWMLGIFCVHPSSAFEEGLQSAAAFPCAVARRWVKARNAGWRLAPLPPFHGGEPTIKLLHWMLWLVELFLLCCDCMLSLALSHCLTPNTLLSVSVLLELLKLFQVSAEGISMKDQ